MNYSDQISGYDSDIFYRNDIIATAADPGIVYVSDKTSPYYDNYYLFGTGRNFPVYVSKDLVSWNSLGYAYTPTENSWEGSDFWAPEVHYDENADPEKYGLTKPEQGKGVYFFIYSSTPKETFKYGKDVSSNYHHETGLAVSTTPMGPYKMWTGKELGAVVDGVDYSKEENFAKYTTAKNENSFRARKNDRVNETDCWFNYAAARAAAQKNYADGTDFFAYDMTTEFFATIDATLFMDNDGQKYVIARSWHHLNSGTDSEGNKIRQSTSNFIFKTVNNDWAQIDYSSIRIMNRTGYNFTSQKAAVEYYNQAQAYDPTAYKDGVKENTLFRCEPLDIETDIGNIVWNEGAQLYHNPDNGLYYLTISLGSTTTGDYYTVIQAVAYNVMGPYRKLTYAEGGELSSNNKYRDVDNVYGPGHHSFITVGDELIIVYHKYPRPGTGARGTCIDRIKWVKNNKGMLVMHDNGPTSTLQPKIYGTGETKYDDIVKDAYVTASTDESNASYLNDGLILVHNIEDDWCKKYNSQKSFVQEFETTKDQLEITLDFNGYRKITSILVYNSKYYRKAFDKRKRIECDFYDDGVKGTFVIHDLNFDMTSAYNAEKNVMRPGCAAIAVFDEIEICKIRKIYKI
ncbi:MAG: family 43 glycosylhydrolase [Clostridia bacterium]|nr:family 43 glycosylhydrolase [Clostridia bacterium]